MIRWIKKLLDKLFHHHKKATKQKRFTASKVLGKMAVMYSSATLANFKQDQLDYIINKILNSKNRYINVQNETKVPWQVIACIHALEGGLNFKTILHNGERLPIVRTRLVPKGRGPFYTWEEAAVDALMMTNRPTEWTIKNTLDYLERYNGLGYRKYHPDINTPYLWSGTQFYTKGKYKSDGKFNSQLKSKQIGAVMILKELRYKM